MSQTLRFVVEKVKNNMGKNIRCCLPLWSFLIKVFLDKAFVPNIVHPKAAWRDSLTFLQTVQIQKRAAWPHNYKSFFMLNSAEHEISMLDKYHLINLLEELLIYRKFHCFSLSNQTFRFDFSYTLKHQRDFKV